MSEKEKAEFGIPESMKVPRRPYTMTEAALEARRRNAQLSTGPKTDEGKKNSSRNAWRHGLYSSTLITGMLGRPCRSTCDKFAECSLVTDGQVEPGDDCLDKVFVAEAFGHVIEAMRKGDRGGFEEMAALEMAGGIDVLRKLKESIIENGVLIKSTKLDAKGGEIGYEYKLNPAVPAYQSLMEKLNFTPGDFLMTPKEIARVEKGEKDADAVRSIAELMSGAAQRKVET